jgi:hypothetical protein
MEETHFMLKQTLRVQFGFSLVCFATSLVLIPKAAHAQLNMASLSGTVTDPSGGAIPGAQVTLSSTTRKANRETVTNSLGLYVIPAILPGSYQVTVAAKGFRTKTITDINLSAGQGSTLNVPMPLGAAVTRVTVTSHPPLLETTTASLGAELQTRTITSIPLNGRNFSDLLPLLPGASTPGLTYFSNLAPAGGTGADTSFYGQKPRDNEFMLDGVPDAEYLFNGIPTNPPPEAIAEMKVESGADSGAYGWASGANIDVVTKSGTNTYHGYLWDYLQNDALNARSFFSPTVSVTRYNQFGAAAGGPLVIPHILPKSKGWYIFGWYEGIRNPSTGFGYQLVPTPAELNGDFSAVPEQIYNPYTSVVAPDGSLLSRSPFANNIIPSGTTNVCSPHPTCLDPNALTIINALSPKPNLTTPGPGDTNYFNTNTGIYNTFNWSARVDHQFGTRDGFYTRFTDARIINSSIYSFSGYGSTPTYERFDNIVSSDTHTFSPTFLLTARFGWQRVNWYNSTNQPEVADQTGLAKTFGLSFGGKDLIPSMNITDFPGYSQGWAYYGPEDLYTYSADLQKILGKHTLQFGGMFIRDHFITNNQTGTDEDFNTIPTQGLAAGTGYGLASFMLGLPSDAGRVIGSTEGDMVGSYPSFYGQDTWHATRKLTVNLGIRYDPQITMKSTIGSGTFVYETGQYVWDRKNPATGAPANAQYGLIPSDLNNVAPRLGIAYSIDPKTVVRASYAMFYDVLGETAQDQQGNRGNWPFAFPQQVASINTGVPNAYFENPFPSQAASSPVPLGCQQCLEVARSATRTPYVQQWSLSVQRQLTPSLMLQTAYFGSHGIDMSGQIVDNTALTPGTNNYQLRQRWPQFPPYVNNGFNQFPAFYDGLSVELRKTYSKSISFMVSYTWSKALDVSDSLVASDYYPFIQPTRFDESLLFGPAGYNIPQRLVASYVWNVPGRTGNKVADAVVGNWKFSGVATFASGDPFFVVYSGDNANIGSVGGRATDFPNLVSNPVLSNPTTAEWFNTSAYQPVPFGTQGNSGKHALYSDAFGNFDCALFKGWAFKERYGLDFRADFFNAFNLHDWGIPNFTIDSGAPYFGQVTSTQQGGRTIQLSLEFHF